MSNNSVKSRASINLWLRLLCTSFIFFNLSLPIHAQQDPVNPVKWLFGGPVKRCEENYGFLPCSDNIPGNLFLLLVYGLFLLKAARLLSDGSELLLTVLNPGIIGGLLLPILGALPDALLILVSGMAAKPENAQSQVLVGMGLLAGSTVMLLTLLWGSSLIVGRCDLYENNGQIVAKDRTLTKPFSPFGTGVTTDMQTRKAAWIMIATVLPYLIAQVPHAFGKRSLGHGFSIAACALSFAGLISYCIYQVASPWIQQRHIYLAKHHCMKSHLLHQVSQYTHQQSWGSLYQSDGVNPNRDVLLKIFKFFDANNDQYLSENELRGLVLGLGMRYYLPEETEAMDWLREFDISRDGLISEDEFVDGVAKWMKSVRLRSVSMINKPEFWDHEAQKADSKLQALLEEYKGEGEDEEDTEDEAERPTKRQLVVRATMLILAGALMAGVFADPLVDAIDNFSKASKIPSFFIAFVATPMATNSSEAISSILFAAKRRKRNISMTYSQIYGAVTMNNTLCLGIFLAIVAIRRLEWNFSSEVATIGLVTVIMGTIGGQRTTFPLWMAFLALLLYPLSIALVAVLDYKLGWQ